MYHIGHGKFTIDLLTPIDIDQLFENKSFKEIEDFFGYSNKEEMDKLEEMYKQGMSTYRYSLVLGVVRSSEFGVIGHCGYHIWNKDHQNAEIFYKLNSDEHKGKGIMSTLIPLVIEYGWLHMNLVRIQARVAEWNTPSIKLLDKLGFKKEGLLYKDYKFEGKFHDSLCYSLIK